MENWQAGVPINSMQTFTEILSDGDNWRNSMIYWPEINGLETFMVLDDYEMDDDGNIIYEYHLMAKDALNNIIKEHYGNVFSTEFWTKREWMRDKTFLEAIYHHLFMLQESGYGEKSPQHLFTNLLRRRIVDPEYAATYYPIFIKKIRIPDCINYEWLVNSNLLMRFRTKEEWDEHRKRLLEEADYEVDFTNREVM